MESPFEAGVRNRLNQVLPGLYDDLGQFVSLPEAEARKAIGLLLDYACQCQHIGNITIGRCALARIPQLPLTELLPACVEEVLDLEDEWEYRRLLELLVHLDSSLLSDYIRIGLGSPSPDIREAATEFMQSNRW